ncbi:MAG: carbohydrate-binding protein [Oscillospiraceae bacterium]
MTTANEHVDLFAAWAYPITYKTGNIRKYGSQLYRCLQDHTSQADWTPDVASAYGKLPPTLPKSGRRSQPQGAHDAYAKGAKVSHSDTHWTSNVDNNVWEPGVYGWTEVAE